MKTKSVAYCILGIIFSIVGALCAYAFDVVLIFLLIVIKQNVFILLLPYLNIGAYVISFIGAIISLFNSKVSGIIMVLSAIINILLLIILCVWLKLFHMLIILFWLPALIILIVGIKAIKKSNTHQKKS